VALEVTPGGGGMPRGMCAVAPGGATAGDDTIVGTPGDDVIRCGAGDDRAFWLGGNAVIDCGSGNDFVERRRRERHAARALGERPAARRPGR
jgi:Ca2+-binding RTX toxin-like protein